MQKDAEDQLIIWTQEYSLSLRSSACFWHCLLLIESGCWVSLITNIMMVHLDNWIEFRIESNGPFDNSSNGDDNYILEKKKKKKAKKNKKKDENKKTRKN